ALHVAHHLADVDPLRRQAQPHATALAAHGVDVPAAVQLLDHLHQVIARYAVRFGDGLDRAEAVRAHRQVHQYPQAVVGIAGEPHGRVLPEEIEPGSGRVASQDPTATSSSATTSFTGSGSPSDSVTARLTASAASATSLVRRDSARSRRQARSAGPYLGCANRRASSAGE